MNIRTLLIGAALAGVLGAANVGAQVLGGGVVGGAGGALSGGLNDLRTTGAGSAAGSFGADLETATLRRTTRNVADRGVGRARGAAENARDRVDSTVRSARGATQNATADAAASTSATAMHAVNPQHISGAAQLAGAAAANTSAPRPFDTSTVRQTHGALGSGEAGLSAQGDRLLGEGAQQTLPTADSAHTLPAAPTLQPQLNASGSAGADADVGASRDGVQTRSAFAGGADADASVAK